MKLLRCSPRKASFSFSSPMFYVFLHLLTFMKSTFTVCLNKLCYSFVLTLMFIHYPKHPPRVSLFYSSVCSFLCSFIDWFQLFSINPSMNAVFPWKWATRKENGIGWTLDSVDDIPSFGYLAFCSQCSLFLVFQLLHLFPFISTQTYTWCNKASHCHFHFRLLLNIEQMGITVLRKHARVLRRFLVHKSFQSRDILQREIEWNKIFV